MPLRIPEIVSRTRDTVARPQRAINRQFSSVIPDIQQFMSRVGQEIARLESAIAGIVVPAAAPAVDTSWLDIVSAPAITVDPAARHRQYLSPATDLTLDLPAAYAGNDTLRLVVAQGATPRLVTFSAAWALPAGVGVEPAALTYSVFEWEFKNGYPFLVFVLQGQALV